MCRVAAARTAPVLRRMQCSLIAATYTPVVAIPMAHDPVVSRQVLLRVWISALAGAVKTFAWPGAPRVLSALTYVAMGWCAVPYFPLLAEAVDTHVVALVRSGGGGVPVQL